MACALCWSACAEDKPVDKQATGNDDPRVGEEDDTATATRSDGGNARVDAGKQPIGAADAGTRPDAEKDASVVPADAGPGSPASKDGGTSASSKDGGIVRAADAGTPTAGGGVCPLKRYPVIDGQVATDIDGFPVLNVNGGVPIDGAGCAQQWEGIVMTIGGKGLCSAAFISDRHLISAAHCYSGDGPVSVKVSAPTWDKGASHTFQAQVKRSGSNLSLDLSIIDLGKPVEWATPDRRFVLHAGMAASVDLHLYGFGDGGSSGNAGTLRGVPKNATLHVTDDGKGNLSGKAGAAQLCQGDSGGPAFVEKTAPVLYGINQAIVPSGLATGTCAAADWTIMFTNVSKYVPFVEQVLGTKCERKHVDDLDVAQCW